MKRFVLITCAAFAAHFSYVASAAVPVEESTEEDRVSGTTSEPRTQPLIRQDTRTQSVRLPEPSRRGNTLDIPPTIEPTQQPTQADVDTTRPAPVLAQDRAMAVRATPVSEAGNLSGLFRQMQIMQQEIQELRGIVEEQEHQIKRLQRDQKEQYLDLDRRVVAISSGQPTPPPASTPTDSSAPAVVPGGSLSERDAYRLAFEGMRAQQFDESLTAFQSLIENYPNGQYTPNAFYWMGEIFLVGKQDGELARQSFMQVVNLYPDHQKAPDAMYKLGVVYNSLGDDVTAKRFLDQVVREHPNSSAAGLARKFLSEL